MSTIEYLNQSPRKSRLLKLAIAVTASLLASLILLGGVWARRPEFVPVGASNNPNRDVERNQTQTPSPQQGSRGASTYPDSPPSPPQTFAPTATSGTQMYINFDNVPSGTVITNQYPPAVFSTDWPRYTAAFGRDYWGSSFPNFLDRQPFDFPVDRSGYAPLYVDFTTPVNDLKFYVVAVDDFRKGIAQVNIFQDHRLTATRNIDGFGRVFQPVLVDVGSMGFKNITRIEVVNITDYLGVGFDDFSFTIAPPPSPTPTPTPSPSPTPFPPTNLHGEGHIEENTLVWDLQAEATGYNVKRRASFESTWTVIAINVQPTVYTSFGNTTPIGRYRDNDAVPDVNYFYAVTAVNANGESADSNVISLQLQPSCGDFQAQRPVQQYYPNPGNGWTLTTQVSDRDGFVVSDVSLNGRYMEAMSVPYFFLKTNKMPAAQRGELTPNSDALTMRARLLRYNPNVPLSVSYDGSLRDFHFVAEYAVDRLSPTSKSCLLITQEYDFLQSRPGDHCEPTATAPCARFRPKVSYQFKGRGGETLEAINIPQRLHFRADKRDNSVGVFRDCDVPVARCGLPPGVVFKDFINPLLNERAYPVVQNGRDIGSWDNFHETAGWFVTPPLTGVLEGNLFGCPECIHTHWRWGTLFGLNFNYGLPIIGDQPSTFNPTNQNVEIGILRYKPEEVHPSADFHQFLSQNESIRNQVVVAVTPGVRHVPIRLWGPADVVFWYSGTSFEPVSDLFYRHGSWFNPYYQEGTTANNSADGGNSAVATQDGIRSITYGRVFQSGATTFSAVDLNTLPPLPANYAALDNRAYQIATDAVVSGPHVVAVDAPSINEESVFNDLAVFHLETDPFDPDNIVWVDDTILSPDTPGLNFNNRIINARVNEVGYFAIGRLVQAQPRGTSDLAIKPLAHIGYV